MNEDMAIRGSSVYDPENRERYGAFAPAWMRGMIVPDSGWTTFSARLVLSED